MAKLVEMSPDLLSNPRVQVFEGSLRCTTLLASCLEGVDAVFATVATNDSIPGCRIAQDTAQSIVAA